MNKTEDRTESSLLWDCFINWSLTLEKTTKQKTSMQEAHKQERPENLDHYRRLPLKSLRKSVGTKVRLTDDVAGDRLPTS